MSASVARKRIAAALGIPPALLPPPEEAILALCDKIEKLEAGRLGMAERLRGLLRRIDEVLPEEIHEEEARTS